MSTDDCIGRPNTLDRHDLDLAADSMLDVDLVCHTGDQECPLKLTSSLARNNSALFLLKLREVQRATQSTVDCIEQWCEALLNQKLQLA